MALATAKPKKQAQKKPTASPWSTVGASVPGVIKPPPPPKGLPATQAPPVVPNPPAPVYGGAPPTAQGQAIRSDAEKAMTGANTDWRDSVYRGVMSLGDPTLIAKYQNDPSFAGYQFAVDPNSTFGQIGESEKHGLQDVDNSSVQGNTFFSGLRLNNRDDVSQQATYNRASAGNTFQEALANYARALAAAQASYNQAQTGANQVDFDAANAVEPVPAASVVNLPPPPTPRKSAADFAKALKAQKKPPKKGK
jgi:hypothetical protein